jgi:hypothetical protein
LTLNETFAVVDMWGTPIERAAGQWHRFGHDRDARDDQKISPGHPLISRGLAAPISNEADRSGNAGAWRVFRPSNASQQWYRARSAQRAPFVTARMDISAFMRRYLRMRRRRSFQARYPGSRIVLDLSRHRHDPAIAVAVTGGRTFRFRRAGQIGLATRNSSVNDLR